MKEETIVLYYTDPLAAAYMAREFGVDFYVNYYIPHYEFVTDKDDKNVCIGESGRYIKRHLSVKDFYDDAFFKEDLINKWDKKIYPLGRSSCRYEVDPDSYNIFEPREGDWIITDDDDIYGEVWSYGDESELYSYYHGGADGLESVQIDTIEDLKIIRRNDKPFFWPEGNLQLLEDLREEKQKQRQIREKVALSSRKPNSSKHPFVDFMSEFSDFIKQEYESTGSGLLDKCREKKSTTPRFHKIKVEND